MFLFYIHYNEIRFNCHYQFANVEPIRLIISVLQLIGICHYNLNLYLQLLVVVVTLNTELCTYIELKP